MHTLCQQIYQDHNLYLDISSALQFVSYNLKEYMYMQLLFLVEEDLDQALETAVENGMLGDLYDIMTHTSDGTLCKVIQILAELGKTGTWLWWHLSLIMVP